MDIAIGIAGLILAGGALYVGWLQLRQTKDRKSPSPGPTKQSHALEASSHSEDKPKMLIIEDVKAQRDAIQGALVGMDIIFRVADNMDDAINLIISEKFSLVTLDMQLDFLDKQGQSGMVLLDQLSVYQPNVPVIVISGLEWSGTQVRNFFKNYDVADFIEKPFDPKEFRSLVEEYIATT